MRINIMTTFLVVSIFVLVAAALASGEETMATTPEFVAASELKWFDLDPTGAPGVKVANLWGDIRTGAFGAFMKLPAGFAAPLHKHTHTMRVVFLSGTYIQAPEGKPEVRLGPSSYMMQPGGDYKHITKCDPASDCVFFVESNGAFDLQIVPAPK